QNLQHREATAPPMPVVSAEALERTERLSSVSVLGQTPDGMAAWRYRLPASSSVRGVDPRNGGGQFWVVLSGCATGGTELLHPNSCMFVAPGDGALGMTAGPAGAELLCVQFPRLARH